MVFGRILAVIPLQNHFVEMHSFMASILHEVNEGSSWLWNTKWRISFAAPDRSFNEISFWNFNRAAKLRTRHRAFGGRRRAPRGAPEDRRPPTWVPYPLLALAYPRLPSLGPSLRSAPDPNLFLFCIHFGVPDWARKCQQSTRTPLASVQDGFFRFKPCQKRV